MTSAYSIELVDYVSRYQSAYKIGSGDITWHDELIHIAKKETSFVSYRCLNIKRSNRCCKTNIKI